jgi:hypothetical protein
MKNKLIVKKMFIKIMGITFILLVLPITLVLVKQTQNSRSSAADADKLETEGGILNSNAQTVIDSSASGGSYVRLNTASTPTPTPTSIPNTSTKGPRYDLYGAGATGKFPPFPTGSNVYVVPTSVTSASNVSRALGDWMNEQVPDGTSATSPTIIVFDNSGGGTKYGSGREYILNEFLSIRGVPPGTNVAIVDGSAYPYYRKNITFWGYNTKIRANFTDGSNNSRGMTNNSVKHDIVRFQPGGFENMKWLGFELQGTNTATGTWDVRYQWAEPQKAWRIASFNNLEFKDNYFHNVGGDWITLDSGLGPPQYDGVNDVSRIWGVHHAWPHGPYNKNAEIAYNKFDGAGNMGIVISSAADGINVHHNILLNSAISPLNIEEPPYAPAGYRFLKNLSVTDNYIENWAWWLPRTSTESYWAGWPMQFARSYEDKGVELNENWNIERNEMRGGSKGYCNIAAQQTRWGKVLCNGGAGGGVHIMPGTWWGGTQLALENRNLVIEDNISNLASEHLVNYSVYIEDWSGVTITGNNFQGLDVKCVGCSEVTFNNNGTSQLK